MNRILVIEPQCWGLEHASFNAALLSAVRCGYPEASIDFLAERGHLDGVRGILAKFDADGDERIVWREIDLPPREMTGWLRLRVEYRQFRSVLRRALNDRVDLVLFASVTNTGVLALKLHAGRGAGRMPILTVIHGMINRITGRWPMKPWNWPLNLRVVLRLWQPPTLWYLLLGPSLHRALVAERPELARNFTSIDIPTLSFALDSEAHFPAERPAVIRFGHLGVGNITKGFGQFARMARDVGDASENVEFILVGHLGSFRDRADESGVIGVSETPLNVDEYQRRASSLTYVVSFAQPEAYRLAANSSFIEALFYGKPGIYLRNDYVAQVFDVMGDIGYLCDDHEEVAETVRAVVAAFPVERYARQMANIRAGRAMFKPEAVGRGLRAVVDVARASAL